MTKEQLEAIKARCKSLGALGCEPIYIKFESVTNESGANLGWRKEIYEFLRFGPTDISVLVAEVEKLRGLLKEP